jgi:hypothetical protein
MDRNGRPEWTGMGGRNQSESVAGMRRNTHPPPKTGILALPKEDISKLVKEDIITLAGQGN